MALFHHIFIDNQATKTLVFLHGTGADENDLLFIGELVKEKYNILSLRGNLSENGVLRFFRRFPSGMFDIENIKDETEKLAKFLQEWSEYHSLTADDYVFLGYSNGANMVLATLLYYPYLIKNAALLHCMLPIPVEKNPIDLSGHKFLATYGSNDRSVLKPQSLKVIETLKQLGADVDVKEYPFGHEIKKPELNDVIAFLQSL